MIPASSKVVQAAVFVTILLSIYTLNRAPHTIARQAVKLNSKLLPLPILEEYKAVSQNDEACENLYGHPYLENLVATSTDYCSPESPSSLTCFHTSVSQDGRVDNFCLATAATSTGGRFVLDCDLKEPNGNEKGRRIPSVQELSRYWYDTGPGNLVEKFVDIRTNASVGKHNTPRQQPNKFRVLLKREGYGNPWHSLMEIMSLTMTFDVLRLAINPMTGNPFVRDFDFDNTRIVMLDGP